MAAETTRRGGCNGRKVWIEVRGEPMRAGLCHCLTCRKETGGPFVASTVWDRSRMAVTGETRSRTAATGQCHFCPARGSSLFGVHDGDGEVEVRLGVLDEASSGPAPGNELWRPRRERRQRPLPGAAQHTGNRP
ncbi:MAG: GFA family protein [Acetobacteraceae bacterium]|nr:GFA family protein [Acetobacteraceae bacterium]